MFDREPRILFESKAERPAPDFCPLAQRCRTTTMHRHLTSVTDRCLRNATGILRKAFFVLCALFVPAMVVPAQDAPSGFEQWTAASLKPSLVAMTEEAPGDPHHFAVRQLADYPNDSFLFVHRAADGQVEWHETQADVFLVESGSATLVVGGRLVNGETVGPHEKRNGSIVGGVRRKLSAGDIVRIPARVPHQLLLEGAPEFNYFVIKVKGY
jgi:mannose-6-phosphate isomerase-like protein (cupin superfamily)